MNLLCKRTGSISLLNAAFQQLVTLLKLMDYHWHKIKAFLWLVESSAEFSEQILYLSVQCRNNRMKCVCVELCGNPSFSPSITVNSWDGTEAPPVSGCDFVPPFLSTGIPLLQGQRGGFTLQSKDISMSSGEGGLGEHKASLCRHSKTYRAHGNNLSYTFCIVQSQTKS